MSKGVKLILIFYTGLFQKNNILFNIYMIYFSTHKIKKHKKKITTKKNKKNKKNKTEKKIGKINHVNVQKGGDIPIKVMTYNVLARGATDHQSDKHGFKLQIDNFHTNPKNLKNDYYNEVNIKKIKMLEHIEQTYSRYNFFKKEIDEQKPEIVLLQEVDNYFYQYIIKNLPDYDIYFNLFIPEERGDLSINFATAVMWNKTLFTKEDAKTLDSESAQKEIIEDETRNADENQTTQLIKPKDNNGKPKSLFGNKNATLVTIKHTATQKKMVVVSVHLPGDPRNENTATIEKQNLIKYVIQKLNDITDTNIKIIGGDFNCPMILNCGETKAENNCCSDVIKTFLKTNEYNEASNNSLNPTTCAFDYDTNRQPALIDAIFFKNLVLNETSIQTINCPTSHPYDNIINSNLYSNVNSASDHAWLMAILQF